MSTYEPGTVAVATVRGVPNVRVMRADDTSGLDWFTAAAIRGFYDHEAGHLTHVRPLVVLDPEGRVVNRLIHILGTNFRGGSADMREALRCLLLPPKPPEPTGLGAVVEDAEGVRWTHPNLHPRGEWFSECGDYERTYDDLNAVRVLSEGVQP